MLYCHDIMICCNLRTFWKTMDKRKALLGQKQCFLGKKCPTTWYILYIILNEFAYLQLRIETSHLS